VIGPRQEMLLLGIAVILLTGSWRDVLSAIQEAISRFRGGGPGSPSHPLPADDSRILRRRDLRHVVRLRG
jgi:hypothetical protein